MTDTTTPRAGRVNAIGLAQTDYKGLPSTLCQGCGQLHRQSDRPGRLQANVHRGDAGFERHQLLQQIRGYFLGQSFSFNPPRLTLAGHRRAGWHHAVAIACQRRRRYPASIGLGQFNTSCGATFAWSTSWRTTASTA